MIGSFTGRLAMRRCILHGFLIVMFALSPVKADIVPPGGRPPITPPAPPGPDKAVIRGLSVERGYTYWRGRRWMTIVGDCASSQPGCQGKSLSGCFVVGTDGRSIDGGDVAALMALDQSAGDATVTLTLEHCELSEIELGR
jgi:hypothetical protein